MYVLVITLCLIMLSFICCLLVCCFCSTAPRRPSGSPRAARSHPMPAPPTPPVGRRYIYIYIYIYIEQIILITIITNNNMFIYIHSYRSIDGPRSEASEGGQEARRLNTATLGWHCLSIAYLSNAASFALCGFRSVMDHRNLQRCSPL